MMMMAVCASRSFYLLCLASHRLVRFHSSGKFTPPLFSLKSSSSSQYYSYSTLICATQQQQQQQEKEQKKEQKKRPNVVKILEERGLLDSLTSDKLRSDCTEKTLRVYCGFDPTAESLHLGNLLGIIVLSWFLRCRHAAVALVGGATGRVGDPSGKTLERPELHPDTLSANISAIQNNLLTILTRNNNNNNNNNNDDDDGGNDTFTTSFVVMNNYDWWKDVKLLDFLKNVGRFARVGTMMSKDSVRSRLEQGMSFTEFTYQLLQGYDFVHLFRNESVNVQIGGSDQWGNITAGTDLIRKIIFTNNKIELQAQIGDSAYGLTFPLLLKSDGTKFGKSEEGAIWLSPSMLSPYKFYQHFFSVPDSDVVTFLKKLTFLPMEEVFEIENKMLQPNYVPNTAQKILAEEVTRFVHGQQGLDEAIKATQALKPGGGSEPLDWETIQGMIGDDVPSCLLPWDRVLSVSVVDLSVLSGLLETKSAARRLLKQGGLYLNNNRVDDEAKKIEVSDIIGEKVLLLSAGKKNRIVVRVS